MFHQNDRFFDLTLIAHLTAVLCLTYSVSARSHHSQETDARRCSANETFGTGCEYYCHATSHGCLFSPQECHNYKRTCICSEGYCLKENSNPRCVKEPIMHCEQDDKNCREFNPWAPETERPIVPTRSTKSPDYEELPNEDPAVSRFAANEEDDYLD